MGQSESVSSGLVAMSFIIKLDDEESLLNLQSLYLSSCPPKDPIPLDMLLVEALLLSNLSI